MKVAFVGTVESLYRGKAADGGNLLDGQMGADTEETAGVLEAQAAEKMGGGFPISGGEFPAEMFAADVEIDAPLFEVFWFPITGFEQVPPVCNRVALAGIQALFAVKMEKQLIGCTGLGNAVSRSTGFEFENQLQENLMGFASGFHAQDGSTVTAEAFKKPGDSATGFDDHIFGFIREIGIRIQTVAAFFTVAKEHRLIRQDLLKGTSCAVSATSPNRALNHETVGDIPETVVPVIGSVSVDFPAGKADVRD